MLSLPEECRSADGGAGLRSVGKAAILQRQLEAKGATVVGLQETKSCTSGVWSSCGWTVVSSASELGIGGCHLWISERQFAQKAIGVVESTNRLLLVTATGKVKLDICVFYAPHLGFDEDSGHNGGSRAPR